MRFENVAIIDVAHVDATHRITSAALEDRLAPVMKPLGVPQGLLENLSGIVARRFWDADTMPSDAATLAAEKLLERVDMDRSKIGIVVNTSVCRDYIEPSVACIVHNNLGLAPTCLNFDVGNACLGFLSGMDLVGNMIERGQIDYGLVVDGENSRYVVETTIERLLAAEPNERQFRGAFATLTLGSGGAAMLLAHKDLAPDAHTYRGGVTLAATQHCKLCRGQVDHMVTDTKNLLVSGIELANRTYLQASEELGWKESELNELVLHQVSQVHTNNLAKALGLSLDKVFRLYPEYGNIGPASVPIVLSKSAEAGRIAKGDRVALMGIGSGLNCTMAEIVW